MTHIYSAIFKTIITISLFICASVCIHAQGIEVEGVLVSEQNASDVLAGMGTGKAGCVTYDPSTHTLTLQNAVLDKGIEVTETSTEITIRLLGTNSIAADPFAIYTEGYVTITGSGVLSVNCVSSKSGGFAMNSEEAVLRFKDCSVSVSGEGESFAVASLQRGKGLLVFDHVDWVSEGLVGAMNRISLKRSDMIEPRGGGVGNKHPSGDLPFANIIDIDRNPNYGTLRLRPNNKYPLRIDDVDVTEENASEIFPNSAIPDGYARYNPQTNRLIVSNVDFFNMNVPNIENFHDETDLPLTIEVRGENTVWSIYSSIYSRGPLIITGPGNLRVKTEDLKLGAGAITMDDRQTLIIKNANVYATGFYGIAGLNENSARIVIEDAYVEMNCTQPRKGGACLIGFQSLELKGVSIKEPAGVYFDSKVSGLLLSDGSLANDRVIIGNDVWNGNAPVLTESDAEPDIAVSGHTLSIDLRALHAAQPARVYNSGGVCLATVGSGTRHTMQLPSGIYLISYGQKARKVVLR